jgi:hypothetical protein
MTPRHLSCQHCRIRVRAGAPEVELLEGKCPICGAKLTAVASSAGVIGFRSFDLDVLTAQESSDRLTTQPVDLVARRHGASGRDDFDGDRWSDDGGSASTEAAACVAIAVRPLDNRSASER